MNFLGYIPSMKYQALVLHGIAPGTQSEWRETCELMMELFSFAGTSPRQVCVEDVHGFSENVVPLKKWLDWIERHGFSEPSFIEFSSGHTGMRRWLTPRRPTHIMCSIGSLPFGGDLVFMVDAVLKKIQWPLFDEMVRRIWKCRRFEYGYALSHPDPITFVSGANKVGLPAADNRARTLWHEFRTNTSQGKKYVAWLREQAGVEAPMQYRECVSYGERLRDIFPRNYLLETHLTQRVGNKSLHDWIKEDLSRGELISLDDGLWCWEVCEKYIEVNRQILEFSGLLVSPRGE